MFIPSSNHSLFTEKKQKKIALLYALKKYLNSTVYLVSTDESYKHNAKKQTVKDYI